MFFITRVESPFTANHQSRITSHGGSADCGTGRLWSCAPLGRDWAATLDPSSSFFGTDLSLGKELLRATASCHKISERFN